MAPFFSIIIPVYNKENSILKTLECVLSQSFQNFEIVIVNDGSTDNSLENINTIKDDRLRIFTIENKGVSHARNFGISQSKAEFIAFLDADDIWLDHHLDDLKRLCEDFPNCGMYCKAYDKIKHNKTIISTYKNIPNSKPWRGIVDDYFDSSLYSSIAWTSAVMVPKSIINIIGDFDENITLGAGEDTDLWIRIAIEYNIAFSNKVSAYHLLDTENRVSHSKTSTRAFINLDKYDKVAAENSSLKKYLDLNRYSIAIQHKLDDNKERADFYIRRLDEKSLTKKQQFFLKQSPGLLKLVLKTKQLLERFGITLNSF